MEVKSLISIKTLIDYENSGHLWHRMSQICLKKLRGSCQISSCFWVFWGKIQLSSAQHVSWFGFGQKIFPGNSLSHMGLSSMPFWSKYADPPTFMKCGINFLKMLKWNHTLWKQIWIIYFWIRLYLFGVVVMCTIYYYLILWVVKLNFFTLEEFWCSLK